MSDMYSTEIPALLVAAIKSADATEARRLCDDADFCRRKLLEGLMSTGRLLSVMSDESDPSTGELRSLGGSIAITAELVAGFCQMVESCPPCIRTGDIREGGEHVRYCHH